MVQFDLAEAGNFESAESRGSHRFWNILYVAASSVHPDFVRISPGNRCLSHCVERIRRQSWKCQLLAPETEQMKGSVPCSQK